MDVAREVGIDKIEDLARALNVTPADLRPDWAKVMKVKEQK